MRRAFLMVGFNNWGKTTLVYNLFDKRRFLVGYGYSIPQIPGQRFTVESHSNDDTGEQRYINLIYKRVRAAPPDAHDLVSVLCPSREPANDACRILASRAFQPFQEIHLLLLRYKWDLHAELRLNDIAQYFQLSCDRRLRIHLIDEGVEGSDNDRGQRRHAQALAVIRTVLNEGDNNASNKQLARRDIHK